MGSDMYCLVGSEDSAEGKRKDWIIDSGASCPMTWQRGMFETYDKLTGSTVRLCKERTVEAAGEGVVKVKVFCPDSKFVTLSF